MILVRVVGTVLWLPEDSPVLFEAGIDHLERFRAGDSFSIDVRVVERDVVDGGRMVVVPVGLTPVDR